jgi:hypothetical protein
LVAVIDRYQVERFRERGEAFDSAPIAGNPSLALFLEKV